MIKLHPYFFVQKTNNQKTKQTNKQQNKTKLYFHANQLYEFRGSRVSRFSSTQSIGHNHDNVSLVLQMLHTVQALDLYYYNGGHVKMLIEMALTLCQNGQFFFFFVKKLKNLYFSDHTISFKFHQHMAQVMYGEKTFNVRICNGSTKKVLTEIYRSGILCYKF